MTAAKRTSQLEQYEITYSLGRSRCQRLGPDTPARIFLSRQQDRGIGYNEGRATDKIDCSTLLVGYLYSLLETKLNVT